MIGASLELRRLDGEGRRWGASVKIETCGKVGSRGVYLRVSPLGSSFMRPVFGNFPVPFVSLRQ